MDFLFCKSFQKLTSHIVTRSSISNSTIENLSSSDDLRRGLTATVLITLPPTFFLTWTEPNSFLSTGQVLTWLDHSKRQSAQKECAHASGVPISLLDSFKRHMGHLSDSPSELSDCQSWAVEILSSGVVCLAASSSVVHSDSSDSRRLHLREVEGSPTILSLPSSLSSEEVPEDVLICSSWNEKKLHIYFLTQ